MARYLKQRDLRPGDLFVTGSVTTLVLARGPAGMLVLEAARVIDLEPDEALYKQPQARG